VARGLGSRRIDGALSQCRSRDATPPECDRLVTVDAVARVIEYTMFYIIVIELPRIKGLDSGIFVTIFGYGTTTQRC